MVEKNQEPEMSSSLLFQHFFSMALHCNGVHTLSISLFSKKTLGAILENCHEEYNCSIMSWINMNLMIQSLLSIRVLEIGIASWKTEEFIPDILRVGSLKKKAENNFVTWNSYHASIPSGNSRDVGMFPESFLLEQRRKMIEINREPGIILLSNLILKLSHKFLLIQGQCSLIRKVKDRLMTSGGKRISIISLLRWCF